MKEKETDASVYDKSIPFPSPSLLLRSVLVVVYAPAAVIIFFSADIPRNRLGGLGASLPYDVTHGLFIRRKSGLN